MLQLLHYDEYNTTQTKIKNKTRDYRGKLEREKNTLCVLFFNCFTAVCFNIMINVLDVVEWL